MPPPERASAQLLRADEDQLDRAAMLLGGSAFVVVVCPLDLQGAALGRWRARVSGVAVPDPVTIDDAYQMLDALVDQAGRKDRVLSLRLGKDPGSAMDGLNLHREKVLEGGAVALWLGAVEDLAALRERAPDAFSFRSTMVLVRGGGMSPPVPRSEEPQDVVHARRRLKKAKTPLERAAAGQWLAEQLRTRDRYPEAERAARIALDQLFGAPDEDAAATRVRLCATLSVVARAQGKMGVAIFWATRALMENGGVRYSAQVDNEARILSRFPGPTGAADRAQVARALELIQSYGLAPETRSQAERAAGQVASAQGDLVAARAHLREHQSLQRYVTAIDRATAQVDLARVDLVAGDLVQAESRLHATTDALLTVGGPVSINFSRLVGCYIDRDELDVAASMLTYADLAYVPLSEIQLKRGDVAAAVMTLREAARAALVERSDADLMDVLAELTSAAETAHAAERLPPSDLEALTADLQRGETDVLALAGPSVPAWYPVELLSFRARIRALDPGATEQAIDLAKEAHARAASAYSDLLAATGRTLADVLLRAQRPDEALAVIADTEGEAERRGFLRDRGYLLAWRVLAHVQRGDAPAVVEPHVAALREALAATGSPRITAEVLRDLAMRLPPACTAPDPHALAEEALGLFVGMPMPGQEARCLEIMGDVLAARGQAEAARRRYLTARTRLERYGLGLRLPLLDRKIAAVS